MKLEIEITRQDYLDYNVHHYIKTKLANSVLFGLAGLIPVLLVINKSKTNFGDTSLFVPALLYIVLYGAITYVGLYNTPNIPTENGAVLGKKELHLTDEALACTDRHFHGLYSWAAIKSMEETKKSFYLHVDTNMAIVIPKRNFSEKEVEHLFRTFVQMKLSVA